MSQRLFCFLVLTAFFSLSARYSSLLAQTNAPGLRVEPAFQEVELKKDQAQTQTSITLVNESDDQQQIELSAVDFRQTDSLGSLAFLDQLDENRPHTLAAFMRFEQLSVVIEPRSEKTITVFIDNRQNLPPGGHYGAVIIRSAEEEVEQDNNTQKVIPALASLILLKKEGEFSSAMSLTDTSLSQYPIRFSLPLNFKMTLKNEGNIHEIPRGQVQLTDVFSRVIAQGTINESSLFVLPENQREYQQTLRKSRWVSPIMLISLQINGYVQGTETRFTFQDSFLYIHPLILLIVLLTFAGLLFWILYGRKKFRHSSKQN